MYGNVWEWSKDPYEEDKKRRVLKGGSWGSSARITQTAYSDGYDPHNSGIDVGFRLHRTLR